MDNDDPYPPGTLIKRIIPSYQLGDSISATYGFIFQVIGKEPIDGVDISWRNSWGLRSLGTGGIVRGALLENKEWWEEIK